MVLDYSKWDKLELSDDSDIEVHPNVDKRSFINAKRRQIHEQRHLRRQQIGYYQTEIAMNNHLLKMITNLISTFDEHKSQPPEEMVMHALVQLNSADHKDAPTPPQGTPGYGQMVAALVDTIKKEVDEQKPADRWQAFLEKFREHRNKLEEQTGETSRKLIALEEEEKTKITSEDVHEGFSVGHINKEKAAPPKQKSVTQKVQAVEQLNNPSSSKPSSGCQSVSSGTEADIDETPGDEDEDDEHIKPTALGREFAKIKIGEYYRCMQYISENPSVVAEKETDGLLIYAFNSQMAGKDEFAKQSVHQALLLQYCRQLGRDGVSLFFKRITTPGHQAQKVFIDDVHQTYSRIKERAREIASEREKGKGVEQIQLHAVDPSTKINVNIPAADSDDPEAQAARKVFESFPPGLQRALETGNLDEVNVVLGKMSVEEAEEVVSQLGEGGMLSLESQIIDATTDEGQKILSEMEEQEKKAKETIATETIEETIAEGSETDATATAATTTTENCKEQEKE